MLDIESVLRTAPVIPVLTIEDASQATRIGEALVEGGLPVIEVTLRTPQALKAISLMREVPGAIVGAGTILKPDDFDDACDAGAQFAVSPGLTDALAKHTGGQRVPFLPGVATAGEVMRALDLGFTHLKFFPATAAGGPAALKALGAVFGQVRFCPTGGISLQTAPEWLSLASVLCVGGSWIVPAGRAADPEAIRELAREASKLRQSE